MDSIRRDVDRTFRNFMDFDIASYDRQPRRLAQDMWDRIGGILEYPYRHGFGNSLVPSAMNWTPRADLRESDKDYLIECELPGVPVEHIKVDVDGGNLTVRGEMKKEDRREDGQVVRSERRFGSFMRSFNLPGLNKLDPKEIAADYNSGVLSIRVPKKEPEQTSSSIPISVTGGPAKPAIAPSS